MSGLSAVTKLPIILPSGEELITTTASAFFNLVAPTKTLFYRGGRVVELTADEDGAWSLSIVKADAFRSKIEKYGIPFAWRAGSHGSPVLKPTCMSKDTATSWLESDERALLPSINGIRNAPVLADDGSGGVRVLPKGYDEKTCLLITGGTEPPILTYSEGMELIELLLAEFDFTTPSDKSRAIAAIISPAMRLGGLLETHFPIFAIEADASQAGKGYLLELIQIIYRETAYMVAKKTGGVGGFDESLSHAMMTGRPFIQFDNVRGRIASEFFEQTVTCPMGGAVAARVPYKGEMEVKPVRFIFQLTSNGFETTIDLANRSCIIRIKKRHGYSFRRFAEGSLDKHVAANQPLFLGAVYAIVREWIKQGRQTTDDTRGQGRFRYWSQVNDWIVQAMGLPPLLDGHERAQESASNPALLWIRQLALVILDQDRLDVGLNASELSDISLDAGLEIPGVTTEEGGGKRRLVVGSIMSRLFHKKVGTIEIEDGFTVERIERFETRSEGRQQISKYYRFERKEPT